jgi:methionyl-tRNA synthetase
VIKLTGKKKFLITCALPYINSVPHLGNLVPILSADVYTRFLRQQNKNAIYICATDDHGTRTEMEAAKRKISPEKYSQQMNRTIKKLFDWFDIQFDEFGRTNCKENHEITTDTFLKLQKKGFVFEKEIIQLYCAKCKSFLPDTYVRGTCPECSYEKAKGDQCDACSALLNPQDLLKPYCNECGSTPTPKTTNHMFLDLPKLSSTIKSWVQSKKEWKGVVKNLPLAWIKEGLKPRCITRDLRYGVKVPVKGFEKKVFYVWFDAPFGYVAATATWAKKKGKNWKLWWFKDDVHYTQFMGKDNVPFHTLIWPGSLLGSGDSWHLVDVLKSNEYLNYKGGQFSKSDQRGIFTDDASQLEFAPDAWRFYLLANLPENGDTNFSWGDFRDALNNQLIANLANFVNRTVTFTKRNFGKVPKAQPNAKGKQALAKVAKLKKEWEVALHKVQLRKGLTLALQISDVANQYFQLEEPWVSIKKDPKKCAQTLATCFEILNVLSEVFTPFIPATAKRISEQAKLKNIGVLFNKVEDARIQELDKKFSGKSQSKKMETKKMIKYDDFAKLDLRVGKILKVEDHPNADKLFKMQVDFGVEKRQVLAGLKGFYKAADLKGQQAVFIVNLEPRNIRGEESQAMILAADEGKKVAFIAPTKNIKNGSAIH